MLHLHPTCLVPSYSTVTNPLICTVSSLAVEETRYPHEYCSHLIYTHVELDFDNYEFVAPMSCKSLFMSAKHRAVTGDAIQTMKTAPYS